jgi:hypothetical protein
VTSSWKKIIKGNIGAKKKMKVGGKGDVRLMRGMDGWMDEEGGGGGGGGEQIWTTLMNESN